MIQRIQTVYLTLTAIAMFLMLMVPLARFAAAGQEFSLTTFGIFQPGGSATAVASLPYMGVLTILACLLPLVTIFFYKKRFVQMRMAMVELVLLLGVQIFAIYYVYRADQAFTAQPDYIMTYQYTCVLPIVGLILTWLAFRGIMKDESLVRSLNRIR